MMPARTEKNEPIAADAGMPVGKRSRPRGERSVVGDAVAGRGQTAIEKDVVIAATFHLDKTQLRHDTYLYWTSSTSPA